MTLVVFHISEDKRNVIIHSDTYITRVGYEGKEDTRKINDMKKGNLKRQEHMIKSFILFPAHVLCYAGDVKHAEDFVQKYNDCYEKKRKNIPLKDNENYFLPNTIINPNNG